MITINIEFADESSTFDQFASVQAAKDWLDAHESEITRIEEKVEREEQDEINRLDLKQDKYGSEPIESDIFSH